jgi:hypothetical protein
MDRLLEILPDECDDIEEYFRCIVDEHFKQLLKEARKNLRSEIKRKMKARRLTYAKLAKKTYCSKSSIEKFMSEKDIRDSKNVISAIKEYLDIPDHIGLITIN